MRRVVAVAFVTLAVAACKKSDAPRAVGNSQPAAAAPAAAPSAAPASTQTLQGKVLEKIDVPQYSYLKLSTSSGDVWAAVQRTDKKAGDEVSVVNAFPMQNFESKELKRKFDVVYFGSLGAPGAGSAAVPAAMGAAGVGSSAMGMPPGQASDLAAQHRAVATGPSDVKVQKVSKASGADARTVQEIWAQRENLKGKTIAVRGQVVNTTPVMGRNFVHLRDGSGSADKKDNDVTVTTNDEVAVGDVVTAKGTIITDKDFGAGYVYPVLVENAKVSK